MSNQQASNTSHYLHGTTPVEQDRLSRLNNLLNELSLRELALKPGDQILDVGSGLGQFTRLMARTSGSGQVVGIERSEEQLTKARHLAAEAGEVDLVEFRQGDATRLPLHANEWGTFDVAHTRFLLEHVTEPDRVVQQMVAAVKPGGRLILEDDGHDTLRLSPEPPGFGQLWNSYMRTYAQVGNDAFIGHRLVSLLVIAGASPIRNTWLFFGACAGQPDLLAAYVDNLIKILEGVRESILALGELSAASFDRCIEEIAIWGQRPDAAMWYAVSWAEGTQRA